jgi:hypothetical protein
MKNVLTTLVKDLATRVTGARTAIGELGAADQALRDAHATAEAERGRLLGARAPKADVLKTLDQELEQLAAAWIAQRAPAVVTSLSGTLDAPAGEIRGVVRYESFLDAVGPLTLPALAALAPALLREGLAGVISRTPYDEGPPLAARAGLVAEVNRTLEALVRQHAELVDSAAAAGVRLEHLPVTTAQRLKAAEAHAAWVRDGAVNRGFYVQHPSARPPEPEGGGG